MVLRSLITFGLFVGLTVSAQANLIITEFMADPTSPDDGTEYFELFNAGPNAVTFDTIADDGSNLVTFAPQTVISGAFFVLGREDADYVNFTYSGFALANSDDEIVVRNGTTELARVNYPDGDEFGDGIALVLSDATLVVNGVTQFSDYIAEVEANDTFPGADIGSPGIAGGTLNAVAVPEPTSLAFAALAGAGGVLRFRRRRKIEMTS